MNTKRLTMMVGLPRCGKSTFAIQRSKALGAPIVNPDSIRLAIHGQVYLKSAEPFVWATAGTMVRSLFLTGHEEVILDATNLTEATRMKFVSYAGLADVQYVRDYVVWPNEPEKSHARLDDSNRHLLDHVIDHMTELYQPISDVDRDGGTRVLWLDYGGAIQGQDGFGCQSAVGLLATTVMERLR